MTTKTTAEVQKILDAIFLTMCPTLNFQTCEESTQGRITLEQYNTLRSALLDSVQAGEEKCKGCIANDPDTVITHKSVAQAIMEQPKPEVVTVDKVREDVSRLMPSHLEERIGSSMGDLMTLLFTVMQINGVIVRGEK